MNETYPSPRGLAIVCQYTLVSETMSEPWFDSKSAQWFPSMAHNPTVTGWSSFWWQNVPKS